ncbi:hypothetical protein [Flavobacterium sp.]|uniref:hypothetical protein n=1 Tax=Flavobacterium sp. TaxID=239 RepID=UPI00262E1DBD|nr:hypothetical protein [Flavobacterium sp.]
MQRNYNYIYSKLVEGDTDLIGHIAYSFYKKGKVEYIEKQEQIGNCLTDTDLIAFNDFSSSDCTIQSYRAKAECTLQGFIDNLLQEELKNYDGQVASRQTEILKDIIKPLVPSFWNTIAIGVISSFAFALLIVIFAVIAEYGNNVVTINVVKTQTKIQSEK